MGWKARCFCTERINTTWTPFFTEHADSITLTNTTEEKSTATMETALPVILSTQQAYLQMLLAARTNGCHPKLLLHLPFAIYRHNTLWYPMIFWNSLGAATRFQSTGTADAAAGVYGQLQKIPSYWMQSWLYIKTAAIMKASGYRPHQRSKPADSLYNSAKNAFWKSKYHGPVQA